LRGEDFWFIVTFKGTTMRQKAEATKPSAEKVIKDLRLVARKQYGAEEKIRIVLDGLRGEESIAALCRREGIAESLYYNWWSKEFPKPARSGWRATRRVPPPPCARSRTRT
jgi:transposase